MRYATILLTLCLGAAVVSPSARDAEAKYQSECKKLEQEYSDKRHKLDESYIAELRIALKKALSGEHLDEAKRIGDAISEVQNRTPASFDGVWVVHFNAGFWGKSLTRTFTIQGGTMLGQSDDGQSDRFPITISDDIGHCTFARTSGFNHAPEAFRFWRNGNRLIVEEFCPAQFKDIPDAMGVGLPKH